MKPDERGQGAVLAYVAVLVMTVMGGSLLNSGLAGSRNHQIQKRQLDLLYLAEGGIEDALARFAQDIANFQVDANAARYPVIADQYLITTYASGATTSSEIVQAQAAPQTVIDPDGTSVFVKNYQINTTVTQGGASMTLHQIVARRIVYTFQHAVFYDKDLEWLPGPNMTLTGRVHSNSDMYLHSDGNTLTIDDDYVRSAGNIYNRRKDSSAVLTGQVQIKTFGSSPSQFVAMNGLDSDDATWATDSQTRWGGTVKSGVHGVTKKAVPVVGSLAPGGYYDTNANVKITNGAITKGGFTLTQGTDVPPNTITTTTTFYNNREGKYVKMTEVDLRKLAGYHDCDGDGDEEQCFPNHLPVNGLIYATRDDVPATHAPGVRLTRGAEISRAAGLTVVSNDPVYVQGHFNTTSKKPCAIIGDAVNLLSGNWNDANSAVNNVNSGSPRTAANTTYNVAFIAGVDNTTSGHYNGGLENFPRLHERWSGQTLTITGSFVSLWNSQLATGEWRYGQQGSNSQYTAPTRVWNYETSFANGTNLPPFTPWAVEMVKGAWWKD